MQKDKNKQPKYGKARRENMGRGKQVLPLEGHPADFRVHEMLVIDTHTRYYLLDVLLLIELWQAELEAYQFKSKDLVLNQVMLLMDLEVNQKKNTF